MGGRLGEEIVFGVATPGASNDIEKATHIARSMVTEYGMSKKLGMVSYEGDHQVFIGRDYGQTKTYSEATAVMIDDEDVTTDASTWNNGNFTNSRSIFKNESNNSVTCFVVSHDFTFAH